MNSDSIPVDLITEILLRLPAKSIARFHCVSKRWASILRRPYFTELFLTRSSAKPRIVFAIEEDGVWSFFSSHQRQSLYDSSLVVAAEFHIKFPPDNMRIYSPIDRQFACGYASGLVYFFGMWTKGKDIYHGVPVICNPNTGKYVKLPYLLRYRKSFSFLGFDPIDKQFKVLFMAYPACSDHHKILTLGTGKMRWRTIKRTLPHDPLSEGICINGVLYYLGDYQCYVTCDETSDCVIVCFDVRSEKFKFIYVQSFCTLVNYKGKLCVVYRDDENDVDAIELRVWVLEDAENEEWSKYTYTLRDEKFFVDGYSSIVVVGVTTMGDIIFSMGYYESKQPFYVFYFNPERNTLQRVEIQGFEEYYGKHSVYTFVDHIEDLNVSDAKLLKSSIYASKEDEEEDEEEEEEDEEEEEAEEEDDDEAED